MSQHHDTHESIRVFILKENKRYIKHLCTMGKRIGFVFISNIYLKESIIVFMLSVNRDEGNIITLLE